FGRPARRPPHMVVAELETTSEGSNSRFNHVEKNSSADTKETQSFFHEEPTRRESRISVRGLFLHFGRSYTRRYEAWGPGGVLTLLAGAPPLQMQSFSDSLGSESKSFGGCGSIRCGETRSPSCAHHMLRDARDPSAI